MSGVIGIMTGFLERSWEISSTSNFGGLPPEVLSEFIF
jgi:hypothetical protein